MKYNDYIDKMPDSVYDAINMAHACTRVRAYAYNNDNRNSDVCPPNDYDMANKCTCGHCTMNDNEIKDGRNEDEMKKQRFAMGDPSTTFHFAQDDTEYSGAPPHGMSPLHYATDFMKAKQQIEQAEETSKMSCWAESKHPEHRENATHNRATRGENMTQNNSIHKQFNDADNTRSIKKALPGGKAVGLGYDGVRGARACNAMSSHVVKSNSMSYFRTINECGKGHACMRI